MKCQKCQKEVFMPFKCQYCGGYFCSEHRLPENHECSEIEQARAPKEETQPTTIQKQKSYKYTITYSPRTPAKMFWFSQKELKHLTLGTLLVIGVGLSFIPQILGLLVLMKTEILISLTIIFTFSFLSHEFAHKLSAQRYGLWAEFRLTLLGALITLISMLPFAFFKIISPGAVMIAGSADRESIGKISITGPMTNIVLSTGFLMAAFLPLQNTPITSIFAIGAFFNAGIALFNLIPFGILDGFKIFLWNKKIWALAFTASLALTIISYTFIF